MAEWYILLTINELPVNKLIKRQVFLQKFQKWFISEDHEAIKIVPHVFISFNCLGNYTSGCGNLYFCYFNIGTFITCGFFKLVLLFLPSRWLPATNSIRLCNLNWLWENMAYSINFKVLEEPLLQDFQDYLFGIRTSVLLRWFTVIFSEK